MTYTPRGRQQAVVDSDDAVLVVLGGPGTGKTVTAAAAAVRHIRVADADRMARQQSAARSRTRQRLPAPTRVLFLSFSRTAVAQVVDRASGVLGPLMSRVDVSTFHGMAWRLIHDFGVETGADPPLLLGAASQRVPGGPLGMTYDDLIPTAMTLLGNPAIAEHVSRRYSLVICDEFQDTSDLEWEFLQAIAPPARRMLLGDVHQCIYAGLKHIDPVSRVRLALELPGAREVDLGRASHRDPTQVLPAAAEAARQRQFHDPAISVAARSGRLLVTRTVPDDAHERVIDIVTTATDARQSVAVFTHTIVATADLSDALRRRGVSHEPVGFDEALGEALQAQLEHLRYASGDAAAQPRRALAVFMTSTAKRSGMPADADRLMSRRDPAIESAITTMVDELRAAFAAVDASSLMSLISSAHGRLGGEHGQAAWAAALAQFRTAVRRQGLSNVDAVAREVRRLRTEALVSMSRLMPQQVQVMNLHQTKGREADVTVLLLQPSEFHGYEEEPFPTGSRLLNVVLTRARETAHIVVPSEPHPLWAPLVSAVEAASRPTP